MSNLFIRRPTTPDVVEAEQVGIGAQSHPQGSRPARPGDWIVTNHATGETTTLTNDEFVAQYVSMAIPSHMDPTQAPVEENFGPPSMMGQPTTAPTQIRTTEPGPIEAGDESLVTEPAIEGPPEEVSPTQPPPVSSNP